MYYNCVWHTKSIYPTKLQVNILHETNIKVIWENVFSHARAMVIGVSSDLKTKNNFTLFIHSSRINQKRKDWKSLFRCLFCLKGELVLI